MNRVVDLSRSIDGHSQNLWHSHRIESGLSTLRSLKWPTDDRHTKRKRDKMFYQRLQPIPREALRTDPQKAETPIHKRLGPSDRTSSDLVQ